MTQPTPLTDQELDDLESLLNGPLGPATVVDPVPARALVAEVRRLRALAAAFTALAERWEQMADHGDIAIGHFEGPAAATLDAEVGERGRTYRKAAADVRNVLHAGRIPDDLLTDAERTDASVVAAGSAGDGDQR